MAQIIYRDYAGAPSHVDVLGTSGGSRARHAGLLDVVRQAFCHHHEVTSRLVYASDKGRTCPTCGWPASDCHCSRAMNQPVPARVRVTLRLEAKGRGGKRVTVIAGLPANDAFLDDLARALKKACAVGGAVRSGSVELAGDVRDRVRPLLQTRGIVVKG